MSKIKKIDFENDSITQNIIQTAMPVLMAQLISLLYSIVDRIFIGRIPGLGMNALGAVGLCFPLIILISAFTNLYGSGGAPLFSISLGSKDNKKAAIILNTSFRLEIITGILVILIFEPLAPFLIGLLGASDAELIYAVPYIRIYILGSLFFMIGNGMAPYISGQGYSKIAMISVLIGAFSNIILDPIFIFVIGLGVKGAAIATVIAQALSAIFVMNFLLGSRNEFKIIKPDFPLKNLLPYSKDIISLGTASFVMQCTNSLVSVATNNVLITTGGSIYVSVMTIVNSVRQILETPIIALSDGTTPVLSYNYGAKRPKRVKAAMKVMAFASISYTFIIWLFIENYPELLIRIFTVDEGLIELAKRPLHLYFFAFIFQALQYSAQTTFKALNKKKRAIFFSLFRKAIIVVPMTYILPYLFNMGTDGVFIAEPISNVVGGCTCFMTMLFTILPELKRMDEQD